MAGNGQLLRLELNNTTAGGSQGLLLRLETSTTAPGSGAQGMLLRVEASAAAVSGAQGQLIRLEVGVPTPVSAGPDQANIEPYTTVNLLGTDGALSTDPRVWAQVSGPAVSDLTQGGKSATFTAPGTILGATLVFGYTAANSAQDTVSIVVLPVTERAVVGGVEVPVRLMTAKL